MSSHPLLVLRLAGGPNMSPKAHPMHKIPRIGTRIGVRAKAPAANSMSLSWGLVTGISTGFGVLGTHLSFSL